MREVHINLLTAGDVATNFTSSAIPASFLISGSAAATLTGAGASIKFQASNDFPINPENWADIPNTTVATTSSGTYLIPQTQLCYQWIRVVYTAAAGTGTITINFMGQGF